MMPSVSCSPARSVMRWPWITSKPAVSATPEHVGCACGHPPGDVDVHELFEQLALHLVDVGALG